MNPIDQHIINCLPHLIDMDFDIIKRNFEQPFFIYYDDKMIIHINNTLSRELQSTFNIKKSDVHRIITKWLRIDAIDYYNHLFEKTYYISKNTKIGR